MVLKKQLLVAINLSRQFEVHQKCNNQNRYQWTSQKINPKIRPCNTLRNCSDLGFGSA